MKVSLMYLVIGGLTWTIPSAYATNGFLAHGYGIKAIGAGGVGIALPQDTLVISSNPAGIAFLPDQLDLGISYFRPDRQAEIVGNSTHVNPVQANNLFSAVSPGQLATLNLGNLVGTVTGLFGSAAAGNLLFNANGKVDANNQQTFFIPEFGYKTQLSPTWSFGIAAYGNGGLIQDYDPGFPLFAGPNGAKTGIELLQLFVTPTIAWKFTPSQSIGLTLNVAYQTFEAQGLGAFTMQSQSPNRVTDQGKDTSYGAGLHVGWYGQLTPTLSLGASYQSRTYNQKFDKYKGLFAEQGDFDIPSLYGLGFAYKLTPTLTLAGDYQRINYSEVKAIGNRLNFSTQLGAANGSGFGWQDINVFKLGLIYEWSDQLTLRAGFNHGDQPVPRDQTLFNVFAPAIVKDHLTLGATWKIAQS